MRRLPPIPTLLLPCLVGCGPPDPLAHAEATWRAHAPARYAFTVHASHANGPMDGNGVFRVVVRDGRSEVRDSRGRQTVRPSVPRSVDALFEIARTYGARARVRWNPRYGFPDEMVVDPDRKAMDDEFAVAVSDFAPLP